MALNPLNNVRVVTGTGGTGSITLGAAYSDNFLTEVEAGAVDGRTYRYRIDEGNDFEVGRGVYTLATRTLTRDVVENSKIAGVAGTTKMTLAGGASVRLVVSAGDFAGLPALDAAQTWTKPQGYAETALTFVSGGTTAWDCDAAPNATLALSGGNTTMGAPTNVVAGRVYHVRIAQDASPRTVAWNSAYHWIGGQSNVPTISTPSGAVDRYTFVGRAGNVLEEVGRAQAVA